eukprot:PhF_6_TR13940/c0_g1_i1/m.22420/K02937/RP-L7e, RPL7; large subunit ribosomal protein L7e
MGKRIPKHIGAGEGERVRVTVLKRRKNIEEHRGQKIRNSIRTHQLARTFQVKGKMAGTKQRRLRSPKEYLINTMRREWMERQVNMRKKHIDTATLTTPHNGGPVLIVRTRGNHDVSKAAKMLLEKYRLNKLHEAVFVAGTKEVAEDMHILKDYVSAGTPSVDQIRELVKHLGRYQDEKGHMRILSGNLAVEKYLGQYGLICVDDIIDAVSSGDQNPVFTQVVTFLAPFNLAPPEHKLERDTEKSLYTKKEMLNNTSIAAWLAGSLQRLEDEKKA